MKKLFVIGFIIFGGALLLFNHASADIFDTYGFGSRGMGMGGAVCSTVEGAAGVFYNPAGLGKNKGFELDTAYFRTSPSMDISFDDPVSPPEDYKGETLIYGDSDYKFGAVILGVAVNLNMIANLPFNTTFGMGLATMDDLKIAILDDIEESHYAYIQFGSPLKLITAYFGIGTEIIEDTLYLGVGGHAMLSGSAGATLALETETLSTDIEEPSIPGSQDIFMEMDAEIEPMFGFVYNLSESLSFGFSYKREISVNIKKFLAILDLQLGSSAARVPALLAIVSNWNPTIYQYGVAYKMDKITVAFDMKQEKWSDFSRGPARDIRRIAPKFDDVTSYHFGAEYQFTDNMNLWGGYAIVPTPIPDQPGESNYLGNDRNILSCGGELRLDNTFGILKFPVYLGGALQYQMLKERDVNKTSDEEPDYSHKGNVLSIMLSARINFDATK